MLRSPRRSGAINGRVSVAENGPKLHAIPQAQPQGPASTLDDNCLTEAAGIAGPASSDAVLDLITDAKIDLVEEISERMTAFAHRFRADPDEFEAARTLVDVAIETLFLSLEERCAPE